MIKRVNSSSAKVSRRLEMCLRVSLRTVYRGSRFGKVSWNSLSSVSCEAQNRGEGGKSGGPSRQGDYDKRYAQQPTYLWPLGAWKSGAQRQIANKGLRSKLGTSEAPTKPYKGTTAQAYHVPGSPAFQVRLYQVTDELLYATPSSSTLGGASPQTDRQGRLEASYRELS